MTAGSVTVLPVTPERLADLERFSAGHGKFRYCSCMRWRMTSSEFSASGKEDRIAGLSGLARQGVAVGVLAYAGSVPAGWCSIAPRTSYRGLERYRKLQRIDGADVWSVACFFVDRAYRGGGVTSALLRGAVRYAQEQGAEVVEGYPVPSGGGLYTYMGSVEVFRAAGFRDVTPSGRERTVMRWTPCAAGVAGSGGHAEKRRDAREAP